MDTQRASDYTFRLLCCARVRVCVADVKWMHVYSVLASFDPDEHDQYYGYNCKVGVDADASPDGRV